MKNLSVVALEAETPLSAPYYARAFIIRSEFSMMYPSKRKKPQNPKCHWDEESTYTHKPLG
ncbi:hypothetical protein H0N96_03635 [Candidatus Micrarchaeota archaeon]|nr:hypothetical protein [Candidatus Micrarchaeota archaeon]